MQREERDLYYTLLAKKKAGGIDSLTEKEKTQLRISKRIDDKVRRGERVRTLARRLVVSVEEIRAASDEDLSQLSRMIRNEMLRRLG